jgi:biopolymer transport protein ExbD
MERVDVPPKSDDNVIPDPAITVMVHADATVSVDDGAPIAEVDLARALAPKLALAHNIFVGFDDGVPWREVVGTIDHVRSFDGVVVALKTHD